MIIKVEASPIKTKRFRAFMDNGKHWDFGLDGAKTYIDHKDKTLRLNYLKRHLGNPTEKQLITNLTPSASVFSAYLLWGKYTDLQKNINHLNNLWAKKHKI